MKERCRIRRVLPLVLLLVLGNSLWATAVERYTYIETTGDRATEFSWNLDGTDAVTIVSEREGERYYNLCGRDGSTRLWRVLRKDTDITAVREGDSISLRGRRQGEIVDTRLRIDSSPWYQPLSYSLRSLLEGDKRAAVFWTIRPDVFHAVKMRAERRGILPVEVDGELVRSEQVRVSLDGFFSAFWHGDYWFRTADRVFVRYEGVHGPPGTPRTVIRLTSKPRDLNAE